MKSLWNQMYQLVLEQNLKEGSPYIHTDYFKLAKQSF